MSNREIASIRRAVASLAPSKNLRRYRPALRARIVGLVRSQPERSVASLATALDMAPQTLARIIATGPARLVPIRVVAKAAQPSSELVLHGPHGITVEGLNVENVAELLRSLS